MGRLTGAAIQCSTVVVQTIAKDTSVEVRDTKVVQRSWVDTPAGKVGGMLVAINAMDQVL